MGGRLDCERLRNLLDGRLSFTVDSRKRADHSKQVGDFGIDDDRKGSEETLWEDVVLETSLCDLETCRDDRVCESAEDTAAVAAAVRRDDTVVCDEAGSLIVAGVIGSRCVTVIIVVGKICSEWPAERLSSRRGRKCASELRNEAAFPNPMLT